MTDHIHDTSAAPEPESASVLTPPLREAVAEALMVAYDECWSSMAGAFSVRHAERLADAALDVVRAAMPEPNREHADCDEHAKPVPVPDPERTLAAMRAAHGILAVGTLDVTSSLNDQRAIASGRRRASLAAYRLARQAEDERRAAR